jgi:hypothetical protein
MAAATGDRSEQRLWAITSYFNPAGYRRRLENYRTFRRHLSAPLVTVEWSEDGRFDLGAGDAEVLVQLTAPDVLWQKERLLNAAMARLPAGCDRVAWLDCDIVFDGNDWVSKAQAALERWAVIQPFSRACDLSAEARVESLSAGDLEWESHSLAKVLNDGGAPPDLLRGGMREAHRCNPGLAWAARREVFQSIGLYDACVIGGGNRAIAAALLGRPQDAAGFLRMNPSQLRHYQAWAARFARAAGGRLGWINQTVHHLWHGRRDLRRYAQRHEDFQRFDFDPQADIVVRSECWRWSSAKSEMHQYVNGYFQQRREDG